MDHLRFVDVDALAEFGATLAAVPADRNDKPRDSLDLAAALGSAWNLRKRRAGAIIHMTATRQ